MASKRIPAVPDEWSEFLMCLMLHMLLPLLPLLLEAIIRKGMPSAPTISLTTALYSMSIGLSSKSKALFGLSILLGIIFSAVFGMVTGQRQIANGTSVYSAISIFFVFIMHFCERYNRHVIDCYPFLEFLNKK